MKNKILIITTLLLILGSFRGFIPGQIHAAEVDGGLVIVDRKPWKISWVQEEKNWVLIAKFDKGTLKTYFNNAPPTKGFGLSSNNKPIKQEFDFYHGQKFTSTNCQYEQWQDGAKCWAFTYKQKFRRNGHKLEFGTTAVIEEVGEAENEIRYSILKDF